jgi:hypothetical protein
MSVAELLPLSALPALVNKERAELKPESHLGGRKNVRNKLFLMVTLYQLLR